MSREIKFRAWDNKTSHFCQDDDYFYLSWNKDNIISGMLAEDKTEDNIDPQFDERAVELNQFTGLKDKNGKDIYEGDVIAFVKDNTSRVEAVVFHSASFSLGSCIDLRRTELDIFKPIKESMEVIGNIYENSNLLTTQSDENT